MASRGFQFKQFYVAHDKCAMKVGTDGTLLGAVATMQSAEGRVLDVGTGSGLVALMLAQRFAEADIDAIDIDEGAVEQATENFAASPWADRLHAYLSKLQDFPNLPPSPSGEEAGVRLYDLIVSNPPYFQNSLKNPDKGREMARHTDSLSYKELLEHSARLLKEDGLLWLILPAEAELDIINQGEKEGLTVEQIVRVHSKPGKAAKRVIIELRKSQDSLKTLARQSTAPRTRVFYIEGPNGEPRSEEYKELTRDFYL